MKNRAMRLPTDAKTRKGIPIFSGCIAYFPLALAAVAELSRIGNEQHNPGKPLHWDRSKSGDELDAQMRHLVDVAIEGDTATDTDGVLHLTKNAWRALAKLQKVLEQKRSLSVRPGQMVYTCSVEGCLEPALDQQYGSHSRSCEIHAY